MRKSVAVAMLALLMVLGSAGAAVASPGSRVVADGPGPNDGNICCK